MTTRSTSTYDHEAEHRRAKRHRHNKRRHRHNPCGSNIANAPSVTLFSIVDTDNNTRNNKWTLKVRWTEVTEAQNGDDVDVDHYSVQIRGFKKDGTTRVYLKTFVVNGKGDDDNPDTGNDPPTRFVHDAILKRGRKYQARVRAAARKRGCPGAWSDWTSLITVGGTTKPSAVTGLTRMRIGPRRIEWNWDDSTDPEFDRYRIEIRRSDTENGGKTLVKTAYPRHSFYRYAVDETDKTKWFTARVFVESEPDDDNARTVSDSSGDTADIQDSGEFGGPSLAPSTPTGVVTRRRLKAVLVRWDDVQDDDTQEPVKYRVYASSSSISASPSFNPATVTKGGESLVTRYWNGSSFVDFTKDDAGTTFYFRVQGKNKVGTSSLSTQVTGSPKKKLSTQPQTDTFGTDDPDVTNVIADQFQAGTSGDRIVIADPADGNAVVKFIGGTGNTTKFTVGNAGNVSVTSAKSRSTPVLRSPVRRMVRSALEASPSIRRTSTGRTQAEPRTASPVRDSRGRRKPCPFQLRHSLARPLRRGISS